MRQALACGVWHAKSIRPTFFTFSRLVPTGWLADVLQHCVICILPQCGMALALDVASIGGGMAGISVVIWRGEYHGGIGVVNAMEVVLAFPGLDGLRAFREWVEAPDAELVGMAAQKFGGSQQQPQEVAGETGA
eukprot:1159238-Pelagomonas_calceolata.AAC.6